VDSLRAFVKHDFSNYPTDGHHPRIDKVVSDAGGDAIEAYSAAWQLVSEGVIVPGAGFALSGNHNDSFKFFPYFSITEYGRSQLAEDGRPDL
jgi:hypothetical protein